MSIRTKVTLAMAGLACLIVAAMFLVVRVQVASAVEGTISDAGIGYVRLTRAVGVDFSERISEPDFMVTLQNAIAPGNASAGRSSQVLAAYRNLQSHYFPGTGAVHSARYRPSIRVNSFKQLREDLQWVYLADRCDRADIPPQVRDELLGSGWAALANVEDRPPRQANTALVTPAKWQPNTAGDPTIGLAAVRNRLDPPDQADRRLILDLAISILTAHREAAEARLKAVIDGGADSQVVGLIYEPDISTIPFLDELEKDAKLLSVPSSLERRLRTRLLAGISDLTFDQQDIATKDPHVRFSEGRGRVGGTELPVREYFAKVEGTSDERVRVFLNSQVIGEALTVAMGVISVVAFVFLVAAVGVALLVGRSLTKPVLSLMEDVNIIAAGNFDHRPAVISRDEVGTLARLLGEMAVSLRAGQELWRSSQAQAHDLEMAREIQENLLAKNTPAVAGYDISAYYSPSKEVGGDYYDFFQVDDDKLGMVCADVSGKGIPGSMIMMMAKALITYQAMAHATPKALFTSVNKFLARDIKRGMFVTAFYIELEVSKRIIRFASAGHAPMLVFRESTQKAFSINPGGIALGFDKEGVLFERNMKEEAYKLEPGDRVMIYTDGVTEAKSPSGEEFGEQRVQQIMARCSGFTSKDFLVQLVRSIEAHAQSSVQDDDITVVTFRVL